MARLYADENFPLQVVVALRGLGHDVVTVAEAAQDGQGIPDDEVLAFAFEQQRILLTLNRRDFIQLHQRQGDHAGIVVCTQDSDTSGQAARIHQAIESKTAMAGELVRVNRPQKRGTIQRST